MKQSLALKAAIHIPSYGAIIRVPAPNLAARNSIGFVRPPVLVAQGELYVIAVLCFGSHHQVIVIPLKVIRLVIPGLNIIAHYCDRLPVGILCVYPEIICMMTFSSGAVDSRKVLLLVHVHGTDAGFVALGGRENIVSHVAYQVVAAMFPVQGVVVRIITVAGIHNGGHKADAVGFVGLKVCP